MLKIKFKCSNQLDACDFGGYCLLQSLYTSSMCSSLIIMDSYLTNECISALFPKKKRGVYNSTCQSCSALFFLFSCVLHYKLS